MSDSSWNEPKYWMMGLYKGERVLASSWDFKKDKIQKNALESIDVETRARDNSSGYLFLQYTFNNNASCEEEIANAKKSSL
ncbi:conserved hypothetical protein [Enterobacterales bacterium 8AC]|nr:conserved hypothetical protein [Enterobacterales bacterium 8AC]